MGKKMDLIPSQGGRILEWYKNWYLDQSKLLRIAALPALAAIIVFFVQFVPSTPTSLLVGAGLCIFVNAYNQYLESLLGLQLDSVIGEREDWKKRTEGLTYLNTVLRNLVDSKSRSFIQAAAYAKENQNTAVDYIRAEGTYKKALDRIMALLHQVFEKYGDAQKQQKFRITFLVPNLVPNAEATHLIAKSWYNPEASPPQSVSTVTDYFRKGNCATLASYMWTRDGDLTVLIDDIPSHIKLNSGNAVFNYTHAGQPTYLKAIICHKVVDQSSHTCLGIICVDTNIVGTFESFKESYVIALEAFAIRIIYETRCAFMKTALPRESTNATEGAH